MATREEILAKMAEILKLDQQLQSVKEEGIQVLKDRDGLNQRLSNLQVKQGLYRRSFRMHEKN